MTIANPSRSRQPPRLHGWRAALLWAVVALEVAYILFVLIVVGPAPDAGLACTLLFLVMIVSLGGVGAVVAIRKPRNPVGWLLWVSATLLALSMGADYVRLSNDIFGGELPGTVVVAWLGAQTFMPALALIVAVVPLYFPDGMLLTPRWRWVVRLAALGIVILVLPTAFTPGPLVNTDIPNPLGVPGFGSIADILGVANTVVIGILFPLSIIACVLRYRRGSATTRQQLKWFAAAAAWTVLTFAASAFAPSPLNEVGWLLGLVGMVLLPIAIGVAILRYRLYDIDRIISRTVSWAMVTGLLAAAFALLVVGLQDLLAPVTSENTLAVAVSTLAVATAFQPLRRRVQRAVDRRFDRARYDGDRLAHAFAERLRDEVSLDAIQRDVLVTVDAAVRPTTVGVWLWSPDGEAAR